MKIKVLIFTIILMLLFSLNVSAQEAPYSISLPENFSTATSTDELDDISKKLGLTQGELKKYFEENGMLFLAVSNDAKTQIRLSALSDDFSAEVGDISSLDEKSLTEFSTSIADESKTSIRESNGRKFIVTTSTLKDSGGVYTVTQYITIANFKTYYLICYNDGTQTSVEVDEIFKSLKITEISVNNWILVISILCIIVFIGLAVLMIIGIIKPYLKNKKTVTCDEVIDS